MIDDVPSLSLWSDNGETAKAVGCVVDESFSGMRPSTPSQYSQSSQRGGECTNKVTVNVMIGNGGKTASFTHLYIFI